MSDDTIDELRGTINDARTTFSDLLSTVNNYESSELKNIIQERLKSSVVNTYKIFEDAPILGLFGRYKPTDEVKEKSVKFFQKQLADAEGSKNVQAYLQEAREIVDKILED